MANLITLSDFAPYYDISSNINSARRLDPCITLAQEIDLKETLGEVFYFDFIKNKTEEKYLILFNGLEYTGSDNYGYTFKGIKVILIHYSYARFIERSDRASTPFGEMTKQDQYSNHLSESRIKMIAQDARSAAFAYQADLARYIGFNRDLYPLWRHCTDVKSKRGINISSIG